MFCSYSSARSVPYRSSPPPPKEAPVTDYDPLTDSDDDGEARLELEARDLEPDHECLNCVCCSARECLLDYCGGRCPCSKS